MIGHEKINRFILPILISGYLAAQCPKNDSLGTIVISGKVTFSPLSDSVFVPIQNVAIAIYNLWGEVVACTYTAQNGTYELKVSSIGLYIIKTEYEGATSIVKKAVVKDDGAEVNFALSKVVSDLSELPHSSKLNMLDVYPNPVKDFMHLKIPSNTRHAAALTISELSGAVIYSNSLTLENESILINATTFPEGFYILQLSTSDRKYIHKFLKID